MTFLGHICERMTNSIPGNPSVPSKLGELLTLSPRYRDKFYKTETKIGKINRSYRLPFANQHLHQAPTTSIQADSDRDEIVTQLRNSFQYIFYWLIKCGHTSCELVIILLYYGTHNVLSLLTHMFSPSLGNILLESRFFFPLYLGPYRCLFKMK